MARAREEEGGGLTVNSEGAGGRLALAQTVGPPAPVAACMLQLHGLQPQHLTVMVEVLVIPIKPVVVGGGRVGVALAGQDCCLPLHHPVFRAYGHTQPPGSICRTSKVRIQVTGPLPISAVRLQLQPLTQHLELTGLR